MTERSNKQAIEFVMERIEKSGQPTAEVQHVLGALSLWRAAHGDFDLPNQQTSSNDSPRIAPSMLGQQSIVPVSSTEIVRFGDTSLREPNIYSDEELHNITELQQSLITLFSPYVAGIQSKVQHAKKPNQYDQPNNTGSYTWQDTKILKHVGEINGNEYVQNKVANVFFNAKFQSRGSFNQAIGMNVVYTYRDKPHKNDWRINLEISNEGVAKLSLTKKRGGAFSYIPSIELIEDLINTLPENTAKALDDMGLKNGRGWKISHVFYIQEIPMRVASEFIYDGVKDTTIRTYDPSKNMFDVTYRQGDRPPEIKQHLQLATIQSAIKGILDTIPQLEN